jgi:hypothetical protein
MLKRCVNEGEDGTHRRVALATPNATHVCVLQLVSHSLSRPCAGTPTTATQNVVCLITVLYHLGLDEHIEWPDVILTSSSFHFVLLEHLFRSIDVVMAMGSLAWCPRAPCVLVEGLHIGQVSTSEEH